MGRIATARGERRERILASATSLFEENGFHGAGIDDIAAAAGVTGPAIYRHFKNKDAVLVALFDRLAERLAAILAAVIPLTGREGLETLVRLHVRLAFEERALIVVYISEERNLPDAERKRARRFQRAYVEAWADLLDGRAIASMQLAGPAGGFLKDEIKVGDDGALAFATAVLRIEAGADRRVLAVSWTKESESPLEAALGVNSEPVYTRPAGLHPLVAEAAVTAAFLDRAGLPAPAGAAADFFCWPLRHDDLPSTTDAAVALVLCEGPGPVEVARWSCGYAGRGQFVSVRRAGVAGGTGR